MIIPDPQKSNQYAKDCMKYLCNQINAKKLEKIRLKLGLTKQQAEHIMKQAINLNGG